MKYLHTLDPDYFREKEQQEQEDLYWRSVAELEAEDRAMEKYYESKHNQ